MCKYITDFYGIYSSESMSSCVCWWITYSKQTRQNNGLKRQLIETLQQLKSHYLFVLSTVKVRLQRGLGYGSKHNVVKPSHTHTMVHVYAAAPPHTLIYCVFVGGDTENKERLIGLLMYRVDLSVCMFSSRRCDHPHGSPIVNAATPKIRFLFCRHGEKKRQFDSQKVFD